MGREVKRVPMDFDWPVGHIWPGYMGGICTEEIGYAIRDKDADLDTMCKACRHFGRLAGIFDQSEGCPVTRIDPPTGEGWQLWETITEGSPCTPVFSAAEGLAQHLADGGGHPLGAPPAYEQALAFVREGWAPSTMSSPSGGLVSGVVSVGEAAKGGGS